MAVVLEEMQILVTDNEKSQLLCDLGCGLENFFPLKTRNFLKHFWKMELDGGTWWWLNCGESEV